MFTDLGKLLGALSSLIWQCWQMQFDLDDLDILELVADMPDKACKPIFVPILHRLASRKLIERDGEVWKLTAIGHSFVKRGNATVH